MTNLNAQRKRQSGEHKGKWTDVTLVEMNAFFGLTILMGVVSLPQTRMFWQKTHWLIETPGFPAIMARDQYQMILRYLHVCDESQSIPKGQPGYDKLYKVIPFLDLLFPNYIREYDSHEHISIDEAMVPWRGRLGFRQFIANKPVRFGIKIWQLADSHTSYVYSQQIYCGANDEDGRPEQGLPSRVVMHLCTAYTHTANSSLVSSCTTTFSRLEYMIVEQYVCNRKHFPKDLVFTNMRNTPRGTYRWKFASPVLAMPWVDNKAVYFLSTIHNPEFSTRTPAGHQTVKRRCSDEPTGSMNVPCPPDLKHYNQYMGGVDCSDQMVRYYYSSRKTARWYIRLTLLSIMPLSSMVMKCKTTIPRLPWAFAWS